MDQVATTNCLETRNNLLADGLYTPIGFSKAFDVNIHQKRDVT